MTLLLIYLIVGLFISASSTKQMGLGVNGQAVALPWIVMWTWLTLISACLCEAYKADYLHCLHPRLPGKLDRSS